MSRYTKEEVLEHRIAWIEALESGRYKQTSTELKSPALDRPRYCCLGVACDVSGLGAWDGFVFVTASSRESLLLPREVSEWLGIRGDDPWLGDMKASQLNDNRRWDFKRIAERARKVWKLP